MFRKERFIVSDRNLYGVDEMAYLIHDKYKDSAMQIPQNLIKLVIEDYIDAKKKVLSNGDVIDEGDLGTIEVRYRRVPKSFSKSQFTVKLDSSIAHGLRESIISEVRTCEDLQSKLGIDNLP